MKFVAFPSFAPFYKKTNMNRLARYGILLVGVAALGFTACEKTNPDPRAPGKDLVLTEEEQEKVATDNRFAFELFRTATANLGPRDNALLSPLSVGMALTMTNNGAAGETRDAIAKVLMADGFDAVTINTYYQKLIVDLPQLDPRTKLDVANSIWYREGFEVLPDFLDVNRTFYRAEVAALDFADAGAAEIINDWVSRETNDKIPTIIDGNVPGNMMMYLINAVYFKGSWEQRFDKGATEDGEFTRADGTTLQTDFMQVEHTFNIAATETAEAVELPYGDKKYSMVVLKPREGRSLADVAEALGDPAAWRSLTASLALRTTQLSLPKFKFSYENMLNGELTDMGMGIAFNPQMADFSGISTDPLVISEVKHKSFIEVNEEGTEAAAVTSVGAVVTSVGPEVYALRVDRPFLFAIREMGTGLILFLGQVNDPSVVDTKG